jgi:hypothetical protein
MRHSKRGFGAKQSGCTNRHENMKRIEPSWMVVWLWGRALWCQEVVTGVAAFRPGRFLQLAQPVPPARPMRSKGCGLLTVCVCCLHGNPHQPSKRPSETHLEQFTRL